MYLILCHYITLSFVPVEDSPEADVRAQQLPYTTVNCAAWSPDRCCSGAQLSHWSSAVAQTRPEVPQGVSVRGQQRRTRHPGSTKWAKLDIHKCMKCIAVSLSSFLMISLFFTQIMPMERPFDSTMDGLCEECLLLVFFTYSTVFSY